MTRKHTRQSVRKLWLAELESVREVWLAERRAFYRALLEPLAHGGLLPAFRDEKAERDWGCLLDRPSTFQDSDEWLARSCSLHFQGGDAWLDYQQRFGRGSLWEQVAQTFNRAARQLDLLRKFGTKPEKELLADIRWMEDRYKGTNPDLVAELRDSAPELKMIFDTLAMESAWPEAGLRDITVPEPPARGGAARSLRANLGHIFIVGALGIIVLGILGFVLHH